MESWCLHFKGWSTALLWTARWAYCQGAQRECTTLASISPYTVMPLPLRALVSEGW